jgi:CheY-like chemotaxis protein
VNILVADDSATMRRIFELTFAGEDARLTCVDSGDAAIARASELSPEVVFVDSSMATDGYKVANAIKSTPGLERTAVILLASQKTPYDEAKGKAAGIDDHVIKPFDTQHLIDKFKRVLAQPRAAAQKPAGAPQPTAGARTARGTVAFEKQPPAAPAAAPFHPAPSQATSAARPPQQPPARSHANLGATMASAGGGPALATAVPAVAAATIASAGDLAKKLDRLGLSPDQIDGVLALSREVIEKVVWEVVPDLAETLIREEIRRLTQ